MCANGIEVLRRSGHILRMALTFDEYLRQLHRTSYREEEMLTLADGTMLSTMACFEASDVEHTLKPLFDDGLEVKQLLGEGGMGAVHAANQRSLSRDVAVKRANEHPSSQNTLLIEARVMGVLDHPNILPIHELGLDESDRPAFSMKKVDGKSWADCLDQSFTKARFNSDDHDVAQMQLRPTTTEGAAVEDEVSGSQNLADDLRIFAAVCQAAHFAHENGVLHRDIKPDNVMVGSFGEVYLVDWGLAVALDNRAPKGLLRAKEVRTISGTLVYAAPEMALPEGTLCRQTDVYLLGATLYELVTGRPPRKKRNTDQMLFEAYCAERPVLPDDCPQELGDIILDCMAHDPAQRPRTANVVRERVLRFLDHAAARELLLQAEHKLAALLSLEVQHLDDEAPDEEANALYQHVRFAVEQVRNMWPSSRQADVVWQQVHAAMAERALSRGHPTHAKQFVDAIDDPPADLVDKVNAAIDEAQRVLDSAQNFWKQSDMGIGASARGAYAIALGVAWLVFNAAMVGLYGNRPPVAYFLPYHVVGSIGFLLFVLRWRDTSASRLSRQAAVTAGGMMLGTTVSWGAAWQFGWEGFHADLMSHGLLALGCLSLMVYNRALRLGFALEVLVMLLVFIWPTHARWFSGGIGSIALVAIGRAQLRMMPRAMTNHLPGTTH